MTNDQLVYSLTNSSLFDTYLVYGIIGLLIFIALIGLIILLVTSYCCLYCYFFPLSSYFCCYHRHRHSSYKLNENLKQQENAKHIAFIKRHSSNITNFSQLYNSCPHLINNNAIITTGINNQNLNASCTTINTLVSPISPCSSFIESVPTTQNNLGKYTQPYIHKINMTEDVGLQSLTHTKNPNEHIQNSRQCALSLSPAVRTRISSSESDNRCTNIYETVIPITNLDSSLDRLTPIYETDWTHSFKQLIINRIPSIELPSLSSPDLVPATDYFQQQNPYDKFLANRTQTSDSMRRINMLQRLKDDAAFLY